MCPTLTFQWGLLRFTPIIHHPLNISVHLVYSTVPFTDKLHLDTFSFVNVLLDSRQLVIVDISLSPISFQQTLNPFNVVLPVMIMVNITNAYSLVRYGQLLTYNGHSVYLQLIMGLTCHHNLHYMIPYQQQ